MSRPFHGRDRNLAKRPQHRPELLPLLVSALIIALVFLGLSVLRSGSPQPTCALIVAPETPQIDGYRFTTDFRIEVRSIRPAMVYVEYSIVYLDTSGRRLVEGGVLRRQLSNGAHHSFPQDVALSPPAKVLGIKILEAHCTP